MDLSGMFCLGAGFGVGVAVPVFVKAATGDEDNVKQALAAFG